MDELELLKEKWQSREQELPKLSYKDIYSMLLKKSSSIVKWIIFISIIELLFWVGFSLYVPESYMLIYEEMGIGTIIAIVNVIHFTIFGIFIYLFIKNYRSIRIMDSTKRLMRSILKMRKSVKYFVIYNVGMNALTLLAANVFFYINKDKFYNVLTSNFEEYAAIPQEQFASTFFVLQFVAGIIVIGFLILLYRIIYGILMKRLKRNYNELKKIEV